MINSGNLTRRHCSLYALMLTNKTSCEPCVTLHDHMWETNGMVYDHLITVILIRAKNDIKRKSNQALHT